MRDLLVIVVALTAGCGRISFDPLATAQDADATSIDRPPTACPRPIDEATPLASLDIAAYAYPPNTSTSVGPTGLYMKPDGTAIYYCDTFYDRCYRATLATPWDITSASPGFDTSPGLSGDSFPADVTFTPDGMQLFVIGSGANNLYVFDLGAAWDITSVAFRASTPVAAIDQYVRAVFFRPDGARIYISGNELNAIHQRVLATPWDITTMSPSDEAMVAIAPSVNGLTDFHFSSDGRSLHFIQVAGPVFEYALTTPWDIATATFTGSTLMPSWAVNQNPRGIWLADDRLYLLRAEQLTIEQFARALCQ